MSPRSRGRPKGRGRDPRRHRGPVRELTQLDHVLSEARGLHDADLLSAQALASAWLGAAWQARTLGQTDAEGDLIHEVVAATRGTRAAAAYLALHALATIPGEDWGDVVGDALIAAPPDLAPTWAVDPRTHVPEAPVRARRWSDPWGANLVHLLSFAEPTVHALLFFETTVGGRYVQAIELGMLESEPDPVIDDLTVTEVEPDDALADVAEALWQTDLYWPPQNDPEYTLTRALAHWRTRGYRRDVKWEPLPDDERRHLIDAFLEQQDGLVDASIVEVLADTFIDFGDGYLHGGVLAWNPGEVERFMLDWVHRKVLLEPECIEALPAVLATWLGFALRRRGLATEHITPVVEMVAELEDEFRGLDADGSAAGPAREILTRMVAAGVDLEDKDAVAQIVSAYNAEQNARRVLDS